MKAANEWQLGQQLMIAVSIMWKGNIHDCGSDWLIVLSAGHISTDLSSHKAYDSAGPTKHIWLFSKCYQVRQQWKFLNALLNYLVYVCVCTRETAI